MSRRRWWQIFIDDGTTLIGKSYSSAAVVAFLKIKILNFDKEAARRARDKFLRDKAPPKSGLTFRRLSIRISNAFEWFVSFNARALETLRPIFLVYDIDREYGLLNQPFDRAINISLFVCTIGNILKNGMIILLSRSAKNSLAIRICFIPGIGKSRSKVPLATRA